MKAIILTYAEVDEKDQKFLKETNLFKLALNQHAQKYNPDERIITDYILTKICKHFPQTIVSIREKFRYATPKVKYPNIEFKGSTIIAAIEYLIINGYDEILIIGDNKVNTRKFQEKINSEISKLPQNVKIYQYKKGNFNLPTKSITNFCNEKGVVM